MSIHFHIPGWLLWMVLGFVVGVVTDRIVLNAILERAIGRAFGWR